MILYEELTQLQEYNGEDDVSVLVHLMFWSRRKRIAVKGILPL